MNVALVMEVPHRIVEFTAVEEVETVNNIPHYKEKGDEQTKLGIYREVNVADDTQLKMDWEEEIKFNSE